MLPLKDASDIDTSLADFFKGKDGVCCIFNCDSGIYKVYQTTEKRFLPFCKIHYITISSEVLW